VKVSNVRDEGTVVLVELYDNMTEQFKHVVFDHRMFEQFAKSYHYDFRFAEFDTDGETVWELD
jgi:hypothetical protein